MRAEVIRAAAELCERNGVPVTVENVFANVAINPGEYSRIFTTGGKREVQTGLRSLGYITNDAQRKTKQAPTRIRLSDLREMLKAQSKNLGYVRAQRDAMQALVQFLEVKEVELGYDPPVFLFAEDARRIFAMHGLELPRDWDRQD